MKLFNRLKEHYEEGLPFVAYRKPDNSFCTALLQKDTSLVTVENYEESGFVMAPFGDDLPTIMIRPDEILEEAVRGIGERVSFALLAGDSEQSGKDEYIDKVSGALEVIKARELQKVVMSRMISEEMEPDPFNTFQILLRQFPEAFCYFLFHPETGIWMGASPETLLRLGSGEISTVSLAGTQKAQEHIEPIWSQKERKEQEYVTNFIEQALEGLTDPPEVSEPRTVKAGNLLHLKTLIKASGPKAGLQHFVRALHPTPAVCGIPTDKARAYLIKKEGYTRAYYTGYLGEINWGESRDSHLFVNLRCMNFKDSQVHIYVGGGLVEGSDPEKEWQETVDKSESMLHLLRNSIVGLG